MKKQLLLGAFLLGSFFTANAQETTSDFSDLTVGQVNADVTGETAGQGGWYVLAGNGTGTTTNMGADTFQVVDNATEYGNVIQVTGPNGSSGSGFMWLSGTDTFWADRTAGNDVFEVEYDFYTGTPGTSQNRIGVWIYDATYNVVLGGFSVSSSTLEVFGTVYSLPQGQPQAGNFTYSLGTQEEPNVILPENTWVTLKIAYSYTEGVTSLSIDGIIEEGSILIGTLAEEAPFEVDLVAFAGGTTEVPNTAAGTGIIDNLTMRAASGQLSTDNFLASQFSIYPNPATDIINITNADNILVNGVTVVDINGRTVKSLTFDNVTEAQINVADLSSGVYLMNISSDNGTTTKKIVKN